MRGIFERSGAPLLAAAGVLLLFAATAPLALASGYATPTTGQSPHGNYSDSTNKCKVCHAVHNASDNDEELGGGTEALLRSKRGWYQGGPLGNPNTGNACVYCHIVGSWAIRKVYNSTLASYTVDSRRNHDDAHRVEAWGYPAYQGCLSCHSVHGSNIIGAPYTAKIMRNDPGEGLSSAATNMTEFCRDCHDEPYDPFGPTKWYGFRCTFCHNTMFFERGGDDDGVGDPVDNLPTFYTEDRDGVTHVMTSTLTAPGGMQVAWNKSSDCRDCHIGGNNTPANDFPHLTSGSYFLDDAYNPTDGPPGTPEAGMDRVCLNCHVQGGDGDSYTTGVGRTF